MGGCPIRMVEKLLKGKYGIYESCKKERGNIFLKGLMRRGVCEATLVV